MRIVYSDRESGLAMAWKAGLHAAGLPFESEPHWTDASIIDVGKAAGTTEPLEWEHEPSPIFIFDGGRAHERGLDVPGDVIERLD